MKKFIIAQKTSVHEFFAIITDLEDTLNFLLNMQIPNMEFTENDIKILCASLIEGQRGEIKGSGGTIKSGSWGVVPVTDGMQGEERVDFVFKPTYLVISILTFVAIKYPDVPESIHNFWKVLKAGYDFAALRNFKGHGYGSESGLKENLDIFNKGGVIDFIKANPDFSKKFTI